MGSARNGPAQIRPQGHSFTNRNFGPDHLPTPPKSKVVDPARFATPLPWAQLIQASYPIYFAEVKLPAAGADRAACALPVARATGDATAEPTSGATATPT